MRKQIHVMLGVVLLTLLLAVPTSASQSTAVSGVRIFHVPPANRVWRPAGNNCIVEFDGTYTYTGDLQGTSVAHFKVVSHGPCGPNGPIPYAYHETTHGQGTFTGEVKGVSGSFDFVETPKVWPEDSHKARLTSQLVVLSGSGDLVGLHGMLEIGWDDDYSGQMHFDPQP